MDFRYAIFDLDGTLLDSMPVWETLGRRYVERNGKVARPDLRAHLKLLTMTGCAEYLISDYGFEKDAGTIVAEMNAMGLEDYALRVPAKPGAVEYLAQLQQKGVKMCVATATDRELVEAALKRLDMMRYFERVYTCTEVGVGKHEPVIYEQAMTFLGGDKGNTAVFEDSLHCVQTATKAGFYTVAVPDETAAADREAIKGLCSVWYDGYAEALRAIDL